MLQYVSKVCTGCGEDQPLEEFTYDERATNGRVSRCKRCERDRLRRRRTDDPEATWRDDFARKLRRHHITVERYDELLLAQCGMCAVETCCAPAEIIDHDHTCCPEMYSQCGKCVRGLLCPKHNKGLGLFRDNPADLRSAADYIERTARG